jgi:hypothetical protein
MTQKSCPKHRGARLSSELDGFDHPGIKKQRKSITWSLLGEHLCLYILDMIVFPFHPDSVYFKNHRQSYGKFHNSFNPVLLFRNVQIYNSFNKDHVSSGHLSVRLNHSVFATEIRNVYVVMSPREYNNFCLIHQQLPFKLHVKIVNDHRVDYSNTGTIINLMKNTRSTQHIVHITIDVETKFAKELELSLTSMLMPPNSTEAISRSEFFEQWNKNIRSKWVIQNHENKSWEKCVSHLIQSEILTRLDNQHNFIINSDECQYGLLEAIQMFPRHVRLKVVIHFRKNGELSNNIRQLSNLTQRNIEYEIYIHFSFSSYGSSLDVSDFLLLLEQIIVLGLPTNSTIHLEIESAGLCDVDTIPKIHEWKDKVSKVVRKKLEEYVCHLGCKSNNNQIIVDDLILLMLLPWKKMIVGHDTNHQNHHDFHNSHEQNQEPSLVVTKNSRFDLDIHYLRLETKHLQVFQLSPEVTNQLLQSPQLFLTVDNECIHTPEFVFYDLVHYDFDFLSRVNLFVEHKSEIIPEFLRLMKIHDKFNSLTIVMEPYIFSEVLYMLPKEFKDKMSIDHRSWCITMSVT